MALPLVQVALDTVQLSEALAAARVLAPEIDVVEAGTLLCLGEGVAAIRVLRTLYPDNIIVADLKIVDAGGELAEMACREGADWVTVMCNAANATKERAMRAAERYGAEIQIELFGTWTYAEAQTWRELGITHAIYHQSRDALNAGGSWSESDVKVVRRLAELGFAVSVTGGLTIETLPLFKAIPVKCFIAGRGLRNADDPAAAARAWKREIEALWS